MTILTSKENPKVRHWARLARDTRYRKAERRALIEGPHLVAALQASGAKAVAILVTEEALAGKEIASLAGKAPIVVSEAVFRSIVDADNPPGIAAEIAIPAPAAKADADVVFLEGVQDPGNVGAIVRSAAAFGAGELVLDQACADPWSPRALRAGMGGQFALAIRQVKALGFEDFRGSLICTVARGGVSLRKARLEGRLGWIFGGEGQGVSATVQKKAAMKVTIPIAPGTESLNVAAAVAVCLYEGLSRPAAGS